MGVLGYCFLWLTATRRKGVYIGRLTAHRLWLCGFAESKPHIALEHLK